MSNDFDSIFAKQIDNQVSLLRSGKYEGFASHNIHSLPDDDPKLMSYHVQQLISEIGELLEADKRWKNFRADKFDRDNKALELADCFIVLMNIAIYSGFSADELYAAIEKKLGIVSERIASQD